LQKGAAAAANFIFEIVKSYLFFKLPTIDLKVKKIFEFEGNRQGVTLDRVIRFDYAMLQKCTHNFSG
jgi:hypothetical protein